jgi:hypothetical protein
MSGICVAELGTSDIDVTELGMFYVGMSKN